MFFSILWRTNVEKKLKTNEQIYSFILSCSDLQRWQKRF